MSLAVFRIVITVNPLYYCAWLISHILEKEFILYGRHGLTVAFTCLIDYLTNDKISRLTALSHYLRLTRYMHI